MNIAESWVGLRVGGEKYQSAFYVFEEMAQTPDASGTNALVAQAVSELHLGRVEEARAALEEALGRVGGQEGVDGSGGTGGNEGRKEGAEDVHALANMVVLNTVAGKVAEAEEMKERLSKREPEYILLKELEEKGKAFDEASKKYSAKVAS